MKSGFLAGLLLIGAAAGALAQEPPPTEPADAQEQEEARPAPAKKKIRVLQDPYDIAALYRSNQSYGEGFGYGNGDSAPLGRVSDNPYAIAGYYRNRQSAPAYSQFWASGYNGSYGGYGRGRGGRFTYGRRIGAHGDLFLIAPTFLAPVGPLTGFFTFDR